jgi:hypothetical protein
MLYVGLPPGQSTQDVRGKLKRLKKQLDKTLEAVPDGGDVSKKTLLDWKEDPSEFPEDYPPTPIDCALKRVEVELHFEDDDVSRLKEVMAMYSAYRGDVYTDVWLDRMDGWPTDDDEV